MPDRAAVKAYLLDLQARIISALEQFDGKPLSLIAGPGRPVAAV